MTKEKGILAVVLTNQRPVLLILTNQRPVLPDPLQGEQLPGPGHHGEGLAEELHRLASRDHCVHWAQDLHLDGVRALLISLCWSTNKHCVIVIILRHSYDLSWGQSSSSVPSLQSLYPSHLAVSGIQSPDSHRQVLSGQGRDLGASPQGWGSLTTGALFQLNGSRDSGLGLLLSLRESMT